jgi:hypothetical protein
MEASPMWYFLSARGDCAFSMLLCLQSLLA